MRTKQLTEYTDIKHYSDWKVYSHKRDDDKISYEFYQLILHKPNDQETIDGKCTHEWLYRFGVMVESEINIGDYIKKDIQDRKN